jgi:hypothetical protein
MSRALPDLRLLLIGCGVRAPGEPHATACISRELEENPMIRDLAIAVGFVSLAIGSALAMRAERPNETRLVHDYPVVSPVETNPCALADVCW